MGSVRIRSAGGKAPGLSSERMKSYGQFCSMARALDLLGERWTLLIVRELLCGSRRFGEIQRGIPRISRTMLAARCGSWPTPARSSGSTATAGPSTA